MIAERTRERPVSERRASAMGAASYAPPAALPQRTLGEPRPRVHGTRPALRRAKQLRRRSPMSAAVLMGTLLVSLLCCYVYAYARVTSAGIELSSLRRELQEAKQEEEALRAEVSHLSLPTTVEQRARTIGMAPAPPQATKVILVPQEPGRETPPQNGE